MVFSSRSRQGFTLIEVLVALVVLSAIGVTLLQTSHTGTEHSRYLQHKLFASWIAEDRATALRLAIRLGQPISFDEVVVKQGGERFVARVTATKQTDLLQRIEIRVFYWNDAQSSQQANPLYQLVSYLPQTAVLESNQGISHVLP